MKKAKPFLKWAGGKNQLLEQFENFYPIELKEKKIIKYIEPFIGGGAVFFDLIQKYNFEYTYISDNSDDLILSYKVIKKEPNELIKYLEVYKNEHNKRNKEEQKVFFLELRKKYNSEKLNINYGLISKNSIERVAQLIYMNKVCFNGLFRLNSKEEFNVPFGDYKNPKILDIENIYLVSKCLQNTEIRNASYEECFNLVDKNTFVYFDPPYRPLNNTSNFNNYSKNGFNDYEQVKLSNFFYKLHEIKKGKLMLSNSDPKNENKNDNFFDNLYKEFFIHRIFANRMINSNSKKRGYISEILITNYNTSKKGSESNNLKSLVN